MSPQMILLAVALTSVAAFFREVLMLMAAGVLVLMGIGAYHLVTMLGG